MNYQKHYNFIINIARSENRNKGNGIYYENHHIIPRCIGGTDDKENLVLLTAKEHYICHKLLTFIYPNEGKLFLALHRMMHTCNNDIVYSGKEYEHIRKNLVGDKHPMKGKTHSEESKQKMRKKHKPYSKEYKEKLKEIRSGEKNPMYGKKHKSKSKKKIGNKNRGRKHSQEAKEKMSNSKKGKKASLETRKKISEAQKGKTYEEIYGIEGAKIQKEKLKKPKSDEHKKKLQIIGKKRRWVYNTINKTDLSINVDILDEFLKNNPHYVRGRKRKGR